MAEHYNIQINIQKVTNTPAQRGHGLVQTEPTRVVTNILELKIVADSEAEAYSKAHRMLAANAAGTPYVRVNDDDPTPT